MPRVHHVKKARKDNPAAKKGEPYYWWKFRYRGKQYSRTRPRRSQLTQSGFLGAIYDLEDGLSDIITESEAQDFCGELEGLLDECQYSLDNMPEQLQDTSESGTTLQNRIEELEDWIGEINNIPWGDVTPEEAAEMIEDSNPGF